LSPVRALVVESMGNQVMHCLFCGKPLSFLSRLRYQRYCSEAHHQEYLNHQEKNGFEELVQTKKAGGNEADEETSVAVAVAEEAAAEPGVAEAVEPKSSKFEETPLDAAPMGPGANENYAHFLAIVDAERHYYQSILESLPAGVAVFLEDRSLAYCNRSFRRMMDNGEGDIYERTLEDLFDHEGVQEAVTETLRGEIDGRDITIEDLGGTTGISLFLSVTPLTAKDGNLGLQVILFLSVLPSGQPAGA